MPCLSPRAGVAAVGADPASPAASVTVSEGIADPLLVVVPAENGLRAAGAPASDEEIRAALGAGAGSLGAVGVTALPVYADLALQGRSNLFAGANEDGYHLRGVDLARDVEIGRWLDLRAVCAGEPCPLCDGPLRVDRAIEVGHIFKLGTRYSELLGAEVLDEKSAKRPIVMGSYGIGVERAMAAIVEDCHDENGIVWPVSVAPYEVVISVVKPKDVESAEAAVEERLGIIPEGGTSSGPPNSQELE